MAESKPQNNEQPIPFKASVKRTSRLLGLSALVFLAFVSNSRWEFASAKLHISLWFLVFSAVALETLYSAQSIEKRFVRALLCAGLILAFLIGASKNSSFFSNQFFRFRKEIVSTDAYLIEESRASFGNHKSKDKTYYLSKYALNGCLLRDVENIEITNPKACKVRFRKHPIQFDRCTRKLKY